MFFTISQQKMRTLFSICLIAIIITFSACKNESQKNSDSSNYYAAVDTGVQVAGIKLIDINTPVGKFKVWTKRIGNNPTVKVLLLHGGPAMTHEYMECFESFFPAVGFEMYEYDQLGSYYSDQPKDLSLIHISEPTRPY